MNPNVSCGYYVYCLSGRLILCSIEVVTFHPFDVFRREITIKGTFAEMTSFAAAIAALRAGRAKTESVTTNHFSIDDYGRALEPWRTTKHPTRIISSVTSRQVHEDDCRVTLAS